MSRRLLLIRHARSDRAGPSRRDHERRLAERGHKAAQRMGAYLRETGLEPDLVLCAPSRRTRETLDRLGLGRARVRFEDALYEAGPGELLRVVRERSGDAATVAVVGHNPGTQGLAVVLAGADRGRQAERLRERLPTGALAVFEVEGEWSEVASDTARLERCVVPGELR